MPKKQLVKIVGKTSDDRLVLSGLFRFAETYGLPLEIIFQLLKDNNMIPSWSHLLEEAKKAQVNMERFKRRLQDNIVDIYGRDYYHEIARRLINPTQL